MITLGCVIGLLLVIGISYAYWSLTLTQTENNVVTTDCFEIEFIEGNAINLSKAYPVSDSDGMKNTPYTFTIKNICDSNAKYQINLETLAPSGKKLPDQYLKANLMESNVSKITSKLESSLNTEPTIEGAVNAYQLLVGELGPKEEKEFSLRIWMHGEVTADMADSMNATYNGKISVITSYYQDKRGTLMTPNFDEGSWGTSGAFWDYKKKVTELVFENELRVHEDAEHTFDVSENQDGSVMSYLIPNENSDTYILYIQSEGGIIANSNSMGLFYNYSKLERIEGLEYLDTSNVTNMSYMFCSCTKLTSLDLSGFNTSNVTNMQDMFSNCIKLTSLDLSGFDTSNVTDMQAMFDASSSLISLDLSGFDTSNVTNMQDMFSNCIKLTSLNVSGFNTNNVTNMSTMFYGCSSLTSLDLSDFDTGNVTTMRFMFSNCSSLISINLSGFDTSKVTSMRAMFSRCGNLISIDLNSFDTSNVTTMEEMFLYCSSLTILDISGFDTSNVTSMRDMFSNCTNLENLNLGLFDTTKVNYFSGIFWGIPSTTIIKVRTEATKAWVLNKNADLNVVVEV